MAKRDRHQFVILAEDKRQYDFARAWLRSRFGQDRVEIRRSQTSLRGSGEQRVRERFPIELRARRQRRRDANDWLVVLIDGDGTDPDSRRQQLLKKVGQDGQTDAAIEADERVLVAVPCRNIETWFRWAMGWEVEETEDYKKRFGDAKPGSLGRKARQRCDEERKLFPPSLIDACEQLDRVARVMA